MTTRALVAEASARLAKATKQAAEAAAALVAGGAR